MKLRCVYDGIDKKLKLFDALTGQLQFSCEAHNDSVADNAWRSDAGCPPGNYTLNPPQENNPPTVPEGAWFCLITGIVGHMGIGIHGGGSCSSEPLAEEQGWCPTENCIRVQNVDLKTFVEIYGQSGSTIPIEVVQSGT